MKIATNIMQLVSAFLLFCLMFTLSEGNYYRARLQGQGRARAAQAKHNRNKFRPRYVPREVDLQTSSQQGSQKPVQQPALGIHVYYNGRWHHSDGSSDAGNPWRDNSEEQRGRTNGNNIDLNQLLNQLFGNSKRNTTSVKQPAVVNKPKPLEHPHSGEWIRIRGKRVYFNSGLVEVYRAGQWGYVCDDSWNIEDASVACRQLGFSRGAVAVAGLNESLAESQWSDADILMDETQCRGTEARLQECSYSTQHDCSLNEVAATMCYSNTGCPQGWVAGFGKCYKFFSRAKNIKLAANACAVENASLVNINSMEENHFLSNILKNIEAEHHTWYTGAKKTKGVWKWFKLVERKLRKRKANRKARSRFRTVRATVEHDRWFPGWPTYDSLHAEPKNARRHDCLTLSDEYQNPVNKTTNTIVNYFFWKANKCRQRGGINFICQLERHEKEKPQSIDCYTGDGSTYKGTTAVTEKGTQCVSWAGSGQINPRTHPNKGLGDHNYCRNPDSDSRPWCWVDHVRRKFGFCKLPQCSQAPQPAPTLATTTDAPDLNCPTEEFYCSQQRICIPGAFRCDNELDCTYGEDEEDCEYSVQEFDKKEDKILMLRSRRESYEKVSYIEVTDEMCAKKCAESTAFICRSFVYDSVNRSCKLSERNSNDGILISSGQYDYYEMTSQKNCTGKFHCENTFCVDPSARCNGVDDCKDLSDELGCQSPEKEDDERATVQLIGGEEHSGTVKISYRGRTGVICDDHWTIEEAKVICRMLGYRNGKKATVMNYFNYQLGESEFLLDNVECIGNETSITDCKKVWGVNDCKAFEIAGVECQISKVCEADQFKCSNELCVQASEVCDGQDNCGDNSDELICLRDHFVLVNGSTPREGRVELVRNGLRGSICDDHWDNLDASVLCKSLGYRYGGEATKGGFFGEGQGPVWMDNVDCTGREPSLVNCTFPGWAKHDCSHAEDAGVKCYLYPPRTTTTTIATTTTAMTTTTTTARLTTKKPAINESSSLIKVNLVGGRDDYEGNVEVIIDNKKYRVCDDYWDNQEATVICRMLGYSGGGLATENSFFGQEDENIIFDNVECDGTESHIDKCKAIVGIYAHDCTNDELAGVICSRDYVPTQHPATAGPASQATAGVCGRRPYDYVEQMNKRRRRRRYAITSTRTSGSAEDDLHSPRTLSQPHFQKVVGGQYAVHGAYPWQVRVHLILSRRYDGTLYGKQHCGAVIVSEYWILSAAHCFYGRRKGDFRMIVGDHHQRTKDQGEQMFEVEELVVHEYYNDGSKDYDVALIKVKPIRGQGIVFNNFVQPACLPDANTPIIEGQKCFISGWGNTKSSSSPYPETLKAAVVPLISLNKCNYLYNSRRSRSFTERMMCAGYIAGGIDTCDGDSGGPLVCKFGDSYTVMGVTSWGRGCALPNAPGVYARITYFLTWINSKITQYSETRAEKEMPTKNRTS